MVTIKELRASHDLSQRGLAEALKVNKNTVNQWEKDITIISGLNLIKVAEFFNVKTDELLNHKIKVK